MSAILFRKLYLKKTVLHTDAITERNINSSQYCTDKMYYLFPFRFFEDKSQWKFGDCGESRGTICTVPVNQPVQSPPPQRRMLLFSRIVLSTLSSL